MPSRIMHSTALPPPLLSPLSSAHGGQLASAENIPFHTTVFLLVTPYPNPNRTFHLVFYAVAKRGRLFIHN